MNKVSLLNKLLQQEVKKIISESEITFQPGHVQFTYVDPAGRHYGTYVYQDRKKQWDKKLSWDETNEFLQSLGISNSIPRRYKESELQPIVDALQAIGIEASYGDDFDVS